MSRSAAWTTLCPRLADDLPLALVRLPAKLVAELLRSRASRLLGELSLDERIRKDLFVGSVPEPSQQAARMIDADRENGDPHPNGRDDQRRRPGLEGSGEALERGPAQSAEREEQRHCGGERGRNFDRQLHQHREVVDEVAHQCVTRRPRLG
jgi:hypothetical protein